MKKFKAKNVPISYLLFYMHQRLVHFRQIDLTLNVFLEVDQIPHYHPRIRISTRAPSSRRFTGSVLKQILNQKRRSQAPQINMSS